MDTWQYGIYSEMHRGDGVMEVKKIHTDKNFNLYVEFTDGQVRKVYIKEFLLSNNPDAIKVKNDLKTFQTAYIEDGVAISWPDLNVSLDPEGIYESGEIVNSKTHQTSANLFRALEKIVKA